MSLLYIFLTIVMFIDCLFLTLLVLLQLPKKDAGAGMAFGAGATDALFGAGSGNVLTKITKWTAGIFFVLAISMAVVAGHSRGKNGAESLKDELMKGVGTSAPIQQTTPAPAATPSNGGLIETPLISNLPPAQTTAPAKSAAPGTNK